LQASTSTENRYLAGQVFTSGAMGWESDDQRVRLALSGNANGTRTHADLETVDPALAQHRFWSERNRWVADRWTTEAEWRRYLPGSAFALGLTAAWVGAEERAWYRRESRDEIALPSGSLRSETNNRSDYEYQDWWLRTGASAGLGRVRAVHGVEQARILEDRLLRSGALERRLARSALEELSRLFYLRPSLAAAYERSDKVFWEEVERVLVREGAIAEPLSAYDLMRAGEPDAAVIGRSRNLRQVGWHAGLACVLVASRSFRDYESWSVARLYANDTLYSEGRDSTASRSRSDPDEVQVGGGIEYHAAPGLAWQVDAWASCFTPTRDLGDAFDLQSQAEVSYRVADRWGTGLVVRQARRFPENRMSGDLGSPLSLPPPLMNVPPREGTGGWSTNATWQLVWYVENRTNLRLEVSDSQGRSPGLGGYARYRAVWLAVDYRLAGALHAPGLLSWLSPGGRGGSF
jgi:hypothetical protein